MGRAIGIVMKKILHKAVCVFGALLLSLFCYLESRVSINTFAEAASVMDFNSTDIESDLSDINSDNYPKDEEGQHELIRFMEYCYTERIFLKAYYGLYFYVYNPTEKALKENCGLNAANMAISYDNDGNPTAWENVELIHLDSTANNRFLKFKVSDSDGFLERAKDYSKAHEGKRRYDIAGVQLYFYDDTSLDTTTATDRTVAKSYIWTGYAKGCGDDYDAESTLACESETFDTLSLDVHATKYRPEGTNSENDYTQDSLHSVYFSVPNKYIEKYGEMVAVHVTWLNAVLKPALVTGNQEAFAAIKDNLGVSRPDLKYYYVGDYGTHVEDKYYTCGDGKWVYPFDGIYNNKLTECEKELETLYMIFNAGDEIDSADSYVVSSNKLQQEMLASANKFGGNIVNGKDGAYSTSIFESIDSEYTDKTIWRDEEYELTSEVVGSSFWDKFFGRTETTSFDGIKAIYAVQEGDITGDSAKDCSSLYISEADYNDFVNYYQDNKSESTVYLFRYQVSDYISQEATLFEDRTDKFLGSYKEIDTNAYFFQETVNLNFDIIDVTFLDGAVETVIPVVSSPLDIIHSATPPVNTTSDMDWLYFFSKIWETLVQVFWAVVAVVVVVLLVKLLIAIGKKIFGDNDG